MPVKARKVSEFLTRFHSERNKIKQNRNVDKCLHCSFLPVWGEAEQWHIDAETHLQHGIINLRD